MFEIYERKEKDHPSCTFLYFVKRVVNILGFITSMKNIIFFETPI